ncbi:deaminase domain-containing protein [Planktothrix agardhii]|uniref:deaminase domain-containing protein n=1 Tax=Planktothrix agardhii TaxID=1160 RepID=UPI0005955EB3|nr:deaminase domain-containing protein [Planktothrix agardhii]
MCIEERLRSDAELIREQYLQKKARKGNVAVIEVHLINGISFGVGATSRTKSPIPKPTSKSEGGQFDPIIYEGYLRDHDAEYKALSAVADTLEMFDNDQVEGKLYLYTERIPCRSCWGVIDQFKEKFPQIEIETFFNLIN